MSVLGMTDTTNNQCKNKTMSTTNKLPGNHPATVKNARIVRTNGKLNAELVFETEGRIETTRLYLTSKAAHERAKKILEGAFQIQSPLAMAEAIGKPCSLRKEYREYNGRERLEIVWINPANFTEEVSADEAAALLEALPDDEPENNLPEDLETEESEEETADL